MMTDPIADMLTRIRNASLARGREVSMPLSSMKLAIAKILKDHGYVTAVETGEVQGRPTLTVTLRMDDNNRPLVQSLTRISKPGRRVYVKATEIPVVRSGMGISILSTPNGLMTGSEARKRSLGGEFICEIY
jgi:small subunit ribosomal protein S8